MLKSDSTPHEDSVLFVARRQAGKERSVSMDKLSSKTVLLRFCKDMHTVACKTACHSLMTSTRCSSLRTKCYEQKMRCTDCCSTAYFPLPAGCRMWWSYTYRASPSIQQPSIQAQLFTAPNATGLAAFVASVVLSTERIETVAASRSHFSRHFASLNDQVALTWITIPSRN